MRRPLFYGGFALAAATFACAQSVAINVSVVSASCAGDTDVLAPDGGVQFLRFTVYADGGVAAAETVSVGSQTLALGQTPLGTLTVSVDALTSQSSSAQILAQGSSGPFTVDSSASSVPVTVFLRAVDRSGYVNLAATPTKCAAMTSPRAYHGQALLADGKVLLYGGVVYGASQGGTGTIDWSQALAIPPGVASSDEIYLRTAEIFDPQSGTFTPAAAPWNADGGPPATPTARAFPMVIPFTNGAAVVVGGESDPASEGVSGTSPGAPLVPSWNAGVYSPSASPPWSTQQTASPHDHGCLGYDSMGDALVAGGYAGQPPFSGNVSQLVTTPIAEYFAPNKWGPFPKVAGEFPAGGNGPQGAVAEQACAGFDGVLGVFQPLVAEVGGSWIDGSGNGWIVQDYYLEQWSSTGGSANFAPYTACAADGSNCTVLGAALLEPRARAKAAPMIVTMPASDGGFGGTADALLVTGGLTCTPASAEVEECAPAFANGATQGQLANSPDSYFWNDAGPEGAPAGAPLDVGLTTELISFPNLKVDKPQAAANMSTERIDHCAVPLPDGRVVIIGGLGVAGNGGAFGTVSSIEVAYDDPTQAPSPSALPTIGMHEATGNLLTPRAGMACTLLQDGSILVTGGLQTMGSLSGTTQTVKTLSSAEIFRPLPFSK